MLVNIRGSSVLSVRFLPMSVDLNSQILNSGELKLFGYECLGENSNSVILQSTWHKYVCAGCLSFKLIFLTNAIFVVEV